MQPEYELQKVIQLQEHAVAAKPEHAVAAKLNTQVLYGGRDAVKNQAPSSCYKCSHCNLGMT